MAILIRRAVVRNADEPVYVDVELEGSILTIGSAVDNSLQLSGMGIAEKHAEVRVGGASGVAQVRTRGRAVTIVNGAPVQRQALQIGDTIDIGSNLLTILDPPAGFELALQVQLNEPVSAINLERSHRTSLQQTWLSKRGLVWGLVILVVALGLAAPLLLGSSEMVQQSGFDGNEIWSSGPLHLAHQDTTKGECNACHTKPFVRVEDVACEQCHAGVVEHAPLTDLLSQSQLLPRCASCHVEHGEPPALISPATDHCQGCHGVSSFGTDHPDFSSYPSSYPNTGRTRIVFDHKQHAGKHFGKTKRDFECAQCHQLDDAGEQMAAGSFASMCVDCHGAKDSTRANVIFHHGDQIMSGDNLAFFTLPRLDLKTLETSELEPRLGYWPPATKGGSRAGVTRLGLTEITELLLSLDPIVLVALDTLREKKTKLASLRRAVPEELAAIAVVVPALKGLLAQLSEDPQATLAVRLEKVLLRPIQPRELTALTGGLTATLVQQAADDWFFEAPQRGAAKSIQAYLDEVATAKVKPLAERIGADAPGVGGLQLGAWQAQKFSLQYRQSGHADDFARAWIALSAELSFVLDESNAVAGLEVSAAKVHDLFADGDAKVGTAKGLGRCTKCHDLQQTKPQDLFADSAWQGSWRDRAYSRRALFAHQPHLVGPDGILQSGPEVCGQCHKPTDSPDYLALAYPADEQLKPETTFAANFEALSPGQCAQCHTPKSAASDTCLQCHAYHPQHQAEGHFPKPIISESTKLPPQ